MKWLLDGHPSRCCFGPTKCSEREPISLLRASNVLMSGRRCCGRVWLDSWTVRLDWSYLGTPWPWLIPKFGGAGAETSSTPTLEYQRGGEFGELVFLAAIGRAIAKRIDPAHGLRAAKTREHTAQACAPVFVTVLSDSVSSPCSLLPLVETSSIRFSICMSVNRFVYLDCQTRSKRRNLYVLHR